MAARTLSPLDQAIRGLHALGCGDRDNYARLAQFARTGRAGLTVTPAPGSPCHGCACSAMCSGVPDDTRRCCPWCGCPTCGPKLPVKAPVEILRAALRDYEEAATDAYIAYRPYEPGAGDIFRRYLALRRCCDSLLHVLAGANDVSVEERDSVAAEVKRASAYWSIPDSEATALRDDILLRLCDEPSQIPARAFKFRWTWRPERGETIESGEPEGGCNCKKCCPEEGR